MSPNLSASQTHNAAVTPALKMLLGPIIEAGGGSVEMMIAGESLIVGIALMCIKLGGDETVLQVMFDGAKERLAELRLGDIQTTGEA